MTADLYLLFVCLSHDFLNYVLLTKSYLISLLGFEAESLHIVVVLDIPFQGIRRREMDINQESRESEFKDVLLSWPQLNKTLCLIMLRIFKEFV